MLRSATAWKAMAQKGNKPMSERDRGRKILLDNKQGVENLLVGIGVFLAFLARSLRLFKG